MLNSKLILTDLEEINAVKPAAEKYWEK